jgi:cytochrome c-type biogenesis protein CcmH
MRRATLLHIVILGLTLLTVTTAVSFAQTPTPNQINEIARELWCPLCNGVRLDNCELQACIQMREVISEKMMAGESKDQIKAYFVQQYGDVVLGQPSREGFNLIAWIFPILAAIVGAGWLAYLVMTWRRKRSTPAAAASSTKVAGSRAEDSDYMKRVEQDLKKLD